MAKGQLNETIVSLSTLTDSYTAGSIIDLSSFEQVALLIKYKKDATEANSVLNFKIEYSPNNVAWYQETYDNGTATIADGVVSAINFVPCEHKFKGITVGDYDMVVYEIPTNCRYMKLSVKETSVIAEYGTVEIKYIARCI